MMENMDLKRKIDIEKHAIPSHFLIVKISGQNTSLIHLLRQIPVSVLCSIILLSSQSFSICFLPINQLVKRSKLVFAVHFIVHPIVHPAVIYPNQIYKQKVMKNVSTKFQALQ